MRLMKAEKKAADELRRFKDEAAARKRELVSMDAHAVAQDEENQAVSLDCSMYIPTYTFPIMARQMFACDTEV